MRVCIKKKSNIDKENLEIKSLIGFLLNIYYIWY